MFLNIHLHCLVLDGVYRATEGVPVFHKVRAPTAEQLQTLLARIITRLMKFLTRKGFLIEEQGMSYSPTPIRIQRSGPCGRQPAPTALRWGLRVRVAGDGGGPPVGGYSC